MYEMNYFSIRKFISEQLKFAQLLRRACVDPEDGIISRHTGTN